jgi:cell division protein FtsB
MAARSGKRPGHWHRRENVNEEMQATMKRTLIPVMLLAGLLAVLFGPSGAFATGTHAQARAGEQRSELASLQRQVADLGTQVKALTAQVKTLKKQTATQLTYIDSIYDQETCLATVTADAFQGTWLVIDKVAQPALATTFFGSPSPVDDKGICSRFKITRTLLQVPPTVAGLTLMINWLQS